MILLTGLTIFLQKRKTFFQKVCHADTLGNGKAFELFFELWANFEIKRCSFIGIRYDLFAMCGYLAISHWALSV